MQEFILGNCLDILKNNNLQLFDGVLTSPPYNLGKNPRHRGKESKDKSMYPNSPFTDAKTQEEYIESVVKLFNLLEDKIKEKGVILWNMGISTKSATLPFNMIHDISMKTDWCIGDVIYWKKTQAMPFQTSPNKTSPYIEPVYVFVRKKHVKDYYCQKPKGKMNEKTGQQFYKPIPNYIEASNGKSTKYNFATFSVEMAEKLLSLYFKSGDCVLDPFAGSGTTMKAAKKLKIDSIGIEIDEMQVNDFIKNN